MIAPLVLLLGLSGSPAGTPQSQQVEHLMGHTSVSCNRKLESRAINYDKNIKSIMSKLISDNPDFFCHNNGVSSRLIYNRVSEDPLIFQVGGYLVYIDLKTKKAYLLSAKTVREAKDEISMIPK